MQCVVVYKTKNVDDVKAKSRHLHNCEAGTIERPAKTKENMETQTEREARLKRAREQPKHYAMITVFSLHYTMIILYTIQMSSIH